MVRQRPITPHSRPRCRLLVAVRSMRVRRQRREHTRTHRRVVGVDDIVGYGQMTYIAPGWQDYSSGYNFFLEFYNGDAIAGYTDKFNYTTLRDAVYVPDAFLPDWADVPLAMTIQPAPEPSSGLLLLIGGALVGLRRKRRVA